MYSLSVIKSAIDKCQRTPHLPSINLLRFKHMVLSKGLGHIVAPPYQDHMNDGAPCSEKERTRHSKVITVVKLLSSGFLQHEADGYQCHCELCELPHNDKRLDCIGQESRFPFEGERWRGHFGRWFKQSTRCASTMRGYLT